MHTVTQEVLDIIAKNADQGRVDRQILAENIQVLKDCGFFGMLLPKSVGGSEHTPQEFFRDHLAIAKADMSTAWACGIVAVHPYQIALMDKQAQDDVFGEDPTALVSSSYNPVGAKVEVVDGGFMVSGRWGWSSGSNHCSWALLGGVIPTEGYRTFLIPRDNYEIEDTWHVMGLQATGSNDVVINTPVFVPEHRTHKQMDGFNCIQDQPNPMYKMPWAQVFIRVVCTPAIGALKQGLELFLSDRTTASTDMTKLAGDVDTQSRIAAVRNIIDECETIMFKNFDEMESNNWEPTMDQRILYRYQASLVIEKCIKGIDTLFDVAGGRSVYNGHALQQIWNDIHIGRAHVANSPAMFARNLGASLLGVENSDFFI